MSRQHNDGTVRSLPTDTVGERADDDTTGAANSTDAVNASPASNNDRSPHRSANTPLGNCTSAYVAVNASLIMVVASKLPIMNETTGLDGNCAPNRVTSPPPRP